MLLLITKQKSVDGVLMPGLTQQAQEKQRMNLPERQPKTKVPFESARVKQSIIVRQALAHALRRDHVTLTLGLA